MFRAIASPSPVPCPAGLVVKKGSKTRGQRASGDPRAVVVHVDFRDVVGSDTTVNVNTSPRRNRIHGVAQQSREHGFQMVRVAEDAAGADLVAVETQGGALEVQTRPEQRHHGFDDLTQQDGFLLQLRSPGKLQQVLHKNLAEADPLLDGCQL